MTMEKLVIVLLPRFQTSYTAPKANGSPLGWKWYGRLCLASISCHSYQSSG